MCQGKFFGVVPQFLNNLTNRSVFASLTDSFIASFSKLLKFSLILNANGPRRKQNSFSVPKSYRDFRETGRFPLYVVRRDKRPGGVYCTVNIIFPSKNSKAENKKFSYVILESERQDNVLIQKSFLARKFSFLIQSV